MVSPDEHLIRSSAEHLYSDGQEIWDPADAWNTYKRGCIDRFALRWAGERLNAADHVLDIGSGRHGYTWLPTATTRLDRFAAQLEGVENGVVGDAESLPFESGRFDAVVCVGSVLNYVSAIECISEIARVSALPALLLLHFESSASAEHIGSGIWRSQAAHLSTINSGRADDIWVYSPTFVLKTLRAMGYHIARIHRFHIASAIALRLGLSQAAAAAWARFDILAAPLSSIADDVILLAERT